MQQGALLLLWGVVNIHMYGPAGCTMYLTQRWLPVQGPEPDAASLAVKQLQLWMCATSLNMIQDCTCLRGLIAVLFKSRDWRTISVLTGNLKWTCTSC